MRKLILLILSILLLNFASAVSTDSLVSYYKLDEITGTNANDAHGINDGTATNARVFTTEIVGIINTGADFTQGDDLITINQHANLVNNDTYTISFWVKGAASGDIFVYTHSKNDADAQSWWFNRGNTDKLRIFIRNNVNVIRLSVTSTTVVFDNAWHHIVFTDNAGTYVYYIDNGVESSGSYTKDTLTLDRATIDGVDRGPGIVSGNYFIDEVSLFNETLDSTGVSDLWNNGNGLAYPFVVDTCACPGAGNNWEIDMSDFCVIQDDCDLTTGTLSFTGSGNVTINSSVDTTNLGDPGANGIIYIADSCLLTID